MELLTNKWVIDLVINHSAHDVLQAVVQSNPIGGYGAETCAICKQHVETTYYAGGNFICTEHWEELKKELFNKIADQVLLNQVRYAAARKTMRIAYREHGKMLLDTMEYLRLWTDDIIDSGHKVFFLGRDMDIFYLLMKDVYKYTPDKVVYLEGWNRSFTGCSVSQKKATIRKWNIQDGDGVVDTGFSGTIPVDIKQFVDIRAMLLTKNYGSYYEWVECFKHDNYSDDEPGWNRHYRSWMVDIEHDLHRGEVVLPTADESIPCEMWDEADELSNHRFWGRVLAYKVALKKAERHEAKEAKRRQETWVYRTKAQLDAIAEATCQGCICKSCYNWELGKKCKEWKHCKPKMGCTNKKLGIPECSSYSDAYNIEPKNGAGCLMCMCLNCEKNHTSCKKGVDSCWGCEAHSYDGITCCDEHVGVYNPRTCDNCMCSTCIHKSTPACYSAPYCSPSSGHTCSKHKMCCSSYGKKSCDSCTCHDCSTNKSCIGSICSSGTDSCFQYNPNNCMSKQKSIQPEDEVVFTTTTSENPCENCCCKDCKNKGSHSEQHCPCYLVPEDKAQWIDKELVCPFPVKYHCDYYTKEEPKDVLGGECKECLCNKCVAVCPEAQIPCIDCNDKIEHCQHHVEGAGYDPMDFYYDDPSDY